MEERGIYVDVSDVTFVLYIERYWNPVLHGVKGLEIQYMRSGNNKLLRLYDCEHTCLLTTSNYPL